MGRALRLSLGISLGLSVATLGALWWGWLRPAQEARPEPGQESAPPLVSPAPAQSGWRVTGLLLRKDANGKVVPAGGVAIRKTREPNWTDPEQAVSETQTLADPGGRFELSGIPSKVWLRIEFDDGVSALEALSVRFPPREGTGHEDLGVRLLRPGHPVAIQVVGPDGVPLLGAMVRAWPNRKYIPNRSSYQFSEGAREPREVGNGEYRMERLAAGPVGPGECELWVHRSGFTWRKVSVVAPADGIVVALERQDISKQASPLKNSSPRLRHPQG
jgi:hypothetical protein